MIGPALASSGMLVVRVRTLTECVSTYLARDVIDHVDSMLVEVIDCAKSDLLIANIDLCVVSLDLYYEYLEKLKIKY